jgi:hypothetical protein
MTNTFIPTLGRHPLYCVWITTGNPSRPLACVWIDPDCAIFRSQTPGAQIRRGRSASQKKSSLPAVSGLSDTHARKDAMDEAAIMVAGCVLSTAR